MSKRIPCTIDAIVNPIPRKPAVEFRSSTMKSGRIERLIPKKIEALQKEMISAIRYGLLESASRSGVLTCVLFSVGRAASVEFRSKKPPAALEITSRTA